MTSRIVRLVAEIDEFKGYWKGMQALSPDTLANYRVLATIESVGSSTRIEGARLSNREVADLLNDIDIRPFQTRDEQEVAGYARAMELIHDRYTDIELTENYILQLHKVLMEYSEKDQWHLGNYKKHPNHVAAFDNEGREIGVIFETASPLMTPQLMVQLVSRTQDRFKEDVEHPLLIIADFVVRFLAIHPFQDGNGRLSRILTNLLLLKTGYQFVVYSSHESMVEANKEAYYQSLRATQANALDMDAELPASWSEFFLEMLVRQKNALMVKIKREKDAKRLPELSERILELASAHGRVTVSFLTKSLGANRNTLKKHLQSLVQKRELIQHGKGRGSYYSRY
jgi:Fic family protein